MIIIPLLIISIYSLLINPTGGFLPIIGEAISARNFLIVFITFTTFYMLGSLIFFIGNNVDTNRYNLQIENRIHTLKRKRTRLIHIGVILIIAIVGIIYPFFFMFAIPTVLTSENLYYNDALEKYETGDSVIIYAEELYYSDYKDGKTIIVFSDTIITDYGDESDSYSVVELPGDQTDKLPQVGDFIFFRGIIKDSEYGYKYVEGVEIVQLDLSSIFIIIISFNLLVLLTMIYFLNKLRILKIISNESPTSETKFAEITEEIQQVQCPVCNGSFEISIDENIMRCPHCGVSGIVNR
jgi:hypothetical protein